MWGLWLVVGLTAWFSVGFSTWHVHQQRVRRAFTLDAVERELYGASKAMQRTQHFKALNDSCAKDVFVMDDADDDPEAMTIDVCSNSLQYSANHS